MNQQRPLLSIDDVVTTFEVSRATIRRRLKDATLPGAFRDGDSSNAPWLIPVESISAAGYKPRKTWLAEPVPELVPEPAQELAQRVHELETQLAIERAAREAAEQIAAAERGRADIAATALRMIEAGTTDRSGSEASSKAFATSTAEESPKSGSARRNWFRRRI